MAHRKAGGSTQLGRESESKRLGVKIYSGQPAQSGQIIIRQRGTKYRPGSNVKRGGDDTLYAMRDGIVMFTRKTIKRFSGAMKKTTFVSVRSRS